MDKTLFGDDSKGSQPVANPTVGRHVRKLWGLHSVSFTLLAHSERPRLIGGSEVSMEKKTEREKIDRSNQSGSILF